MMGKDLLVWRKQRGLTQRELALSLGVRNLAVSRWERGERRIPALLPLALEALEYRMQKGGNDPKYGLMIKDEEVE
jgi:transcriptional regulator with XRE-family HTH domain